MTTPKSLLDDLTRRGVLVESRGKVLHVEAPAGVLSDIDWEALRNMKSDILLLLVSPLPEPFLRAFQDGCKAHGVTHEGVADRWGQVRADEGASICGCCCGPCYVGSDVCSRCAGLDPTELRTAPPCVVCAQPGYTPTDTGWLCETCHTRAYRA